MTLELDAETLNQCVGCGLCLPHCPTFRVTGEEALSPRGRIDAMRIGTTCEAPLPDAIKTSLESCVQCMACEPACPSGVQYGSLIGASRTQLADDQRLHSVPLRLGLAAVARHRLLLLGSTLLALAQRAHVVPRRFAPGKLPLRRGPRIRSTSLSQPDVWLFTGCVMDAWFRPVHRATVKLFEAVGATYAVASAPGCCGALDAHLGFGSRAKQRALEQLAAMPGDVPIVVNSAGCGAHLRHYGTLLQTEAAERFAARVVDVHEWLEPRLSSIALRPSDAHVIVHDPCHLQNVQRKVEPMHALLERVAQPVRLDDDGLCCGAGGAYSVVQPELAAKMRRRKVESIDRAVNSASDRGGEVTLLVSANPGCSWFLQGELAERGIDIAHPVQLLAEALQ